MPRLDSSRWVPNKCFNFNNVPGGTQFSTPGQKLHENFRGCRNDRIDSCITLQMVAGIADASTRTRVLNFIWS